VTRTLIAVTCLAGLAAPALGQVQTQPTGVTVSTPAEVRTGVPQRDTLIKVMKRISVDFQEKRLEDVMNFVKDYMGADLDPLWIDERNTDGLDKERLVSVKVDNVTTLALIERILESAQSDFGGSNSWQMTETGAMQIGPKARLNKFRRVEIYDVTDLITEIPDYRDVPRIDLQQALQASQGGGGGGQSPFRDDTGGNERDQELKERQERATEVMELIRSLVEMDQWVENGGDGGSMRYWQGGIIVNAPDYMHRGINGYPYWPSAGTSSRVQNGKRYVTLNGDAGLARVAGFGQQPVSAVVNGQVISSGGGGRKR